VVNYQDLGRLRRIRQPRSLFLAGRRTPLRRRSDWTVTTSQGGDACARCCRHEGGLGRAIANELVGGEDVKRNQGLAWRHGLSNWSAAKRCKMIALDACSCSSEADDRDKPLRRRGNLLRAGLDSQGGLFLHELSRGKACLS